MSRLRRGERVLARVPDWLGDLVMAEPALRALHERVRELEGSLAFAGSPRLLEVFGEAFDGVERVAVDDARAWSGRDLAVLFTNSFRSAWLAWSARIPRRVGYDRDGRALLLTEAFAPAREVGRAPIGIGTPGRGARYLPRPFGATCVELVHWLGASVRDPRPRLKTSASGAEACTRRLERFGLRADERFVLANVGARPASAKGYPAELWARALAALELPVVLVCGPGEEAPLQRVQAELAGRRVFACLDPIADLRELVALCERAEIVLTADAGPRHVAAAVGARLVVVAGPTDPRHTADHTRGTKLLREPVECGPCHREDCGLPEPATLACMRGVEPRAIAEAARELLVTEPEHFFPATARRGRTRRLPA